MSVINQMLRHLDQRKAQSGGEPMPGGVIRSVEPRSSRHLVRNLVWAGMVVAIVALGLGGWLKQRGDIDAKPAPAPALRMTADAMRPAPPAPASAAAVAAAASAVAIAETTAVKRAPAAATASPTAPASAAFAARLSAVAEYGEFAASAPAPRVAAAAPPPAAPVAMPPVLPRATAAGAKAGGAKTYSPKQVSQNLFAEAVALDQQGRVEEAKAPLQRALKADPLDLEARRMLVQLEFDTGRVDIAKALLTEGHQLMPDQSAFTLTLARLQVEGGDAEGAMKNLKTGLPSAGNEPQYHAFLAALLLRAQSYDDALQHYIVALRSDPANASWLVGAGAAFEGLGKRADAAEAYLRANSAENLTPELAKFVEERLAQLRR